MSRNGRATAACAVSVLLAGVVAACSGYAQEWPQFRGPGGQGHAETTGLALRWSETENVRWRTPIPGKGWSSPVVENDRIWMTTAIESPVSEGERARRLEGNTNNQPLVVSGPVSLRAVCVERSTGRLLHDIEVLQEDEPEPIHELNSFASPTPVVEAGRVYCHFGSNGTACLDSRTLEVLWRNQTLKIHHENGPGGSPVIFDDFLIFHCDGSDTQYVVALEKETGRVAWKTDRSGKLHEHPQLKKAYGTPLIVARGNDPWLISPAANWVYGYDPRTGRELWKVDYEVLGFSVVPRPVAGHGLFFVCTCFGPSELLAVRYEDESGTTEPRIAWRYRRQVPKMSSPLLVGDELYFVGDRGIMTCLDATTGEEHWRERVGGNFASSPIYADGRIYLGNQEGEISVLRPGRKFQLLAKNQLQGRLMASPVAVDGALFLRTDRALYRIEARNEVGKRTVGSRELGG